MRILQLLSTRNYIIVNRDLVKLLGLEEAIMLGELASEYDYWLERNELEDDYFYSTIENIQQHTLLKEQKQRKILNSLKDKDLIDIKIKGIPAKRYIKINEEHVLKALKFQFREIQGTSFVKTKELVTSNSSIKNNNKEINNMNIVYNWNDCEICDCETKDKTRCQRRSTYKINGKNYCNQHSKVILSRLFLNTKDKTHNLSILTSLLSINNYQHISNDTTDKVYVKLQEWLQYKEEKKEYYKETGLKNLLSQIDKKIDEYGEEDVIELISECMANNWKGIIFDKLKQRPKSTLRMVEEGAFEI